MNAATGTVQARRLSEGRALLENEHLRFTFTAKDAGAADEILLKASGKALTPCVSYNSALYRAFRESYSTRKIAAWRADSSGHSYELVDVQVNDGVGEVVFTGYPVKKGPARKVRLTKTYRLRAGMSKLDIELRCVNEGKRSVPFALWILNGLRVDAERVTCFCPSAQGTLMREDPWVKSSSSFLNAGRTTAPWTAAMGCDPDRSGMVVVTDSGYMETVHNWLGKFSGYTLGFGTPKFDLLPGESQTVSYSFMGTLGLSRVDAASRTMACGIDFVENSPVPGQPLDLVFSVMSTEATRCRAKISLRKLPDGAPRELGGNDFELTAGKAASHPVSVVLKDEGTYVLSVVLTSRTGEVLHAERPLVIGDSAEQYRCATPDLLGKPFWSLDAEKPLNAAFTQCDRDIRYPMVPWAVPALGERPKVLFAGIAGYTTGVFRDLARRMDAEWDFVSLQASDPSSFGSGRTDHGCYRNREQKELTEKLTQLNPDCMFTAGIQYRNTEPFVVDAFLSQVKLGMGLVIVGRPDPAYAGVWPAILKRDGFTRIEAPRLNDLQSLFSAGVAPRPFGTVACYAYGKGRIVMITKAFEFYEGDYARNDLLPQIRGKSRLPDWEYHFGQYVQAVYEAAQRPSPVRILSIGLERDAITIEINAQDTRRVSLSYDVVSVDRLRGEHAIHPVELKVGQNRLRFETAVRPGNEYVVHAWLLDGDVSEPESVVADGLANLSREAHPAPVLDFTARDVQVDDRVQIDAIAIEDATAAIPSAITVNATRLAGTKPEALDVVVEIRNGHYTRVAWRGQAQWGADESSPLVFRDIAYTPVAPESTVAVTIRAGSEVLCSKAHRILDRSIANVADHDVAYITTTGTQGDWYATRILEDWAVGEAGFDRTFYQRGNLSYALFSVGGSFPWKREAENTLSPSIIDEGPLRAGLASGLRKAYEHTGSAYFCMHDEFQLRGEYDWSSGTLAAFRDHLSVQYGTVTALNAEWGTTFRSFDEAMPVSFEDARSRPDNLAAWMDFRLYIDARVNRRYEIANEEAAKISPNIRVGESGMYAPGHDVGVNYYTVGQSSRFMMTYGGLRSDWIQAFLLHDTPIGVWLGYGWQQPHLPWKALFKGRNIVAWWGFIVPSLAPASVIYPDLTLGPQYAAIGQQQAEIRDGIGKLFVEAKPVPARVLIPYSQASVYAADLLEHSFVNASTAAISLLNNACIPYSFVADEQAAAGGVNAMRDVLFLMAGCDAMPVATVEAYVAAVEHGCSLVADAEVATRNGHGRKRTEGGLDTIIGISRQETKSVEDPLMQQINWTGDAPLELRGHRGQMAIALTGIKATQGEVWATTGEGEPAVVVHRTDSGSFAMFVNTRFEWSRRKHVKRAENPEDRPDEMTPDATVAALVSHVLSQMGIGAPVGVAPTEFTPQFSTEFEDGDARYYGILLGKTKGLATVRFPRRAHTYDVRAGKYLGETAEVQSSFDDTQLARVYAQLPYVVKGISVNLDNSLQCPGDTISLSGKIDAGGKTPGLHVIHCEVVKPDGSRPWYFKRNMSASAGRFELTVPLALNAVEGTWSIELKDVASGTISSVPFTVRH